MNDTLTITYRGGIDSELDKKIISAIEPLGYEWYGQGTVIGTGIRDIAFKKVTATGVENLRVC